MPTDREQVGQVSLVGTEAEEAAAMRLWMVLSGWGVTSRLIRPSPGTEVRLGGESNGVTLDATKFFK